jgi:hypothetical protein
LLSYKMFFIKSGRVTLFPINLKVLSLTSGCKKQQALSIL